MYNSGIMFYIRMYRKYNYKKKYEKLVNQKTKDRCFIIGNGPSINKEDLDKLVNEDCFGTNGLFKIYAQTKFRSKYYLIQDRYVSFSSDEIRNIETENMIFSDYYCRFNKITRENWICFHQKKSLIKKEYINKIDVSKRIYVGATVSYTAMLFAAYIGYKEIYLIGFDHDYENEAETDGHIKSKKVNTHFYQDENPEEIIFDKNGIEANFIMFKHYAKDNNITIKNLTRGGKLEIFERDSIENIVGF